MFEKQFKNLKEKSPLVECITNYVTINDVANAILASGASPVMAEELEEIEEFVDMCDALLLNVGTLISRTIESMMVAGKHANKLNKPVIIDPVGIGASKLRRKTCFELLDKVKFAVIRGNASEIKTVLNNTQTSNGVDVSLEDSICEENLESFINIAKEVSKRYRTVTVITGLIDIITDGETSYIIRNGSPSMENVTGTGCMLGGLIGGFVGANSEDVLNSTALAVAIMALSGELAQEKVLKEDLGTGSLRTFIIDNISKMNLDILNERIKVEII